MDLGRTYGRAIATGWTPSDMDRKFDVEADLMAAGLGGMELERKGRLILARFGIKPIHEAIGFNTLVNGGTAIMLDALIGVNPTFYTNALAATGVGDSAVAFSLAHTNLQGAVNVTDRIRKAMDATFPSRAANVVTWRSTFLTSDANFTWNEWAWFNNVTDGSGTMLNRAVVNLGTKTAAASWQLTTTLTQT
jgi:hypothetical protein